MRHLFNADTKKCVYCKLKASETNHICRPKATFRKRLQACSTCEISNFCNHKVPPTRSAFCHLLIVGGSPTESDYISKEPLTGSVRPTLERLLQEALQPTTTYMLTNTILCTPYETEDLTRTREPSLSEIHSCRKWLTETIRLYKPLGIISLGKISDTNLTELNIDHLAIMHPSAIMRAKNYDYEFDKARMEIIKYENQVIPQVG